MIEVACFLGYCLVKQSSINESCMTFDLKVKKTLTKVICYNNLVIFVILPLLTFK